MKTISVLVILFGFHNLKAQFLKNRSSESIAVFTVQTGGTIFYGEISRRALLPQNRKSKKDYGTASSFSVMIKNNKGINTRISVISGTLNGIRYDVLGGYQRYFENTFHEEDLTVAFDLFKNRKTFKNLTIAGMMGFGVINYRSVLRSLLTDRLINSAGYAKYDLDYPQLKMSNMRMDMIGIVGGSVSYKVRKDVEILIEHSYRIATSSNLDAIDGGGVKDCYSYTSFGMSYTLNSINSITTARNKKWLF